MNRIDNEELRFNEAKKKIGTIILIVSIMFFILVLLCGNFTNNINFIPLATKNDGFFIEVIAYAFIYTIFFALYYAIMFFFTYIIWYIISSKNKDFMTNEKYRGHYGIISKHNPKYDKELNFVLNKVVKLVSIIEFSILFIMFMFGIIKF